MKIPLRVLCNKSGLYTTSRKHLNRSDRFLLHRRHTIDAAQLTFACENAISSSDATSESLQSSEFLQVSTILSAGIERLPCVCYDKQFNSIMWLITHFLCCALSSIGVHVCTNWITKKTKKKTFSPASSQMGSQTYQGAFNPPLIDMKLVGEKLLQVQLVSHLHRCLLNYSSRHA